jgi:hypothetical protein
MHAVTILQDTMSSMVYRLWYIVYGTWYMALPARDRSGSGGEGSSRGMHLHGISGSRSAWTLAGHGHWQGRARHGRARHGTTSQVKARQGKASQGKARQGKARQSKARIAHKRTAELDCTSTYSSNSCRATPAAKVAARHAVTATGREKERGEVS